MTVTQAQNEMRLAYASGATGALASGLIWLLSGAVALLLTPERAVITLFIGGMFIFPLSVLMSKTLGRAGKHSPENPLGHLALESTFFMLACLPLAYVVFLYRSDWFFPAMMFIIGGRYFSFQTIYGTRLYWLLAAVLLVAAVVLLSLEAAPVSAAFVGGGIEVVFALILFRADRRLSTS